ncbi:DUF6458 family protein [Streptacidiphilus monticola]|jgi:hypothetical protein|uniref:DUF6458 family protein n=1 Tax=Streptacidiphilus monticola TaxID=2161674 RepID=A0ABW1GCX6_9ACTN
MGIGGSIVLLAVGAVLAFAVHWHPGGVDIRVVGWILMAAGALWLVVMLSLYQRRRVVVRTASRRPGPAAPGEEVVEERRDYEP